MTTSLYFKTLASFVYGGGNTLTEKRHTSQLKDSTSLKPSCIKSLKCCHAYKVMSHKLILNSKGFRNGMIGTKVMAIKSGGSKLVNFALRWN